MAEPSGYAVIVDRISHDMPFYRSFLKNAVLTGTQVINNPFWWSADDKFFNFALATKTRRSHSKTVLLPHKKFPPQISERSLRNCNFLSTGTASSTTSASRLPKTARRWRLARRPSRPQPRRILPRLRPHS